MKTDYSKKTNKELWVIWSDSYEEYIKANKEGKFSKAEKAYKVFSKAKNELRYVRNLY